LGALGGLTPTGRSDTAAPAPVSKRYAALHWIQCAFGRGRDRLTGKPSLVRLRTADTHDDARDPRPGADRASISMLAGW